MLGIRSFENRHALSNELHARPFPVIEPPCKAICLAIRPDEGVSHEDVAAHLSNYLNQQNAAPLMPGAAHYYDAVGRGQLKWERHTEFFTYTFFLTQNGMADFEVPGDIAPTQWLEEIPGEVLTAAVAEIDVVEAKDIVPTLNGRLRGAFVDESLAVSSVLDASAFVASDFRIDASGYVRFFVGASASTGKRRVGRIVQRLFEIETYKTMAMLTLPQARLVSGTLGAMDERISALAARMAGGATDPAQELDEILQISAELEALSAQHSSRFSAADAYSALVSQRIELLREDRIGGRQSLGEFMIRRFDPAMRTCTWTYTRLGAMAERAARVGDMMRTRIGVAREAQNVQILEQMDKRASQQLKLQETVEGLSVIAVSYYAVGLLTYLLSPPAATLGIPSKWIAGALVIPVVILVWLAVKRVRRAL